MSEQQRKEKQMVIKTITVQKSNGEELETSFIHDSGFTYVSTAFLSNYLNRLRQLEEENASLRAAQASEASQEWYFRGLTDDGCTCPSCNSSK